VSNCLFCGIVAGEIPATVVAESEHTLAFLDINPQAPVHVLVVPRRHIADADALDDDDGAVLAELFATARSVASAQGIATAERGYRLAFNVGPDACNSVPHLHLHVLGGRALSGAMG
jgi:histidine triad (HIT) family protein